MAQQSVIYPSEPLLIVDRQWRKKRKDTGDVPAFSIAPTRRDVTITVLGKEGSTLCNAFKIPNHTKDEPRQPASKHEDRQIHLAKSNHQHQPCPAKKRKNSKRNHDKQNRLETMSIGSTKRDPSDVRPDKETWYSEGEAPRIGALVPNSSTTFYAYAGPHVKSNAQDLLDYCMLPSTNCPSALTQL
jgi:hypothetical protein